MEEARGNGVARVVVAHPDAAVRLHLVRALADDGFLVQEAQDAAEVLRHLELHTTELLILPSDLPGADGRPLLAALPTHPARATMAVLALDPQPTITLLDAGADDVLTLPPPVSALRLRARALVRLKRSERAGRILATRLARAQRALRNAAERLAAGGTPDEVLVVAAEVVRHDLGIDRVAIALYDPVTSSFLPRLSTDEQGKVGPPRQSAALDMTPGSPLRDLPAYQAIFEHSQRSYFLPDVGGHAPAYHRPLLEGPMCEALVVALPAAAGPLGLLTADNLLTGRRLGPEDARLLELLAGQLALALERAHMAAELAARAREAEALARAGAALAEPAVPARVYGLILEQAATALPADLTAVLRYERGYAILAAAHGEQTLPAGTTLFPIVGTDRGWIPSPEGEPAYLPDTQREPSWRAISPWVGEHLLRSVIGAPITIEGEPLGSVIVASRTPDFYNARQIQLAAAFAERIGQAMRNARLLRAEQERARAAEELAKMRDEFVAAVSHELRTPLSAIVGFTEILQTNWSTADERTRLTWVEKIAAAATRQRRLVEDLLLVTRLENGALESRSERITLAAVAQRAAEEVQGSYQGQRIDLIGDEHLAVLADMGRTLQVVANLIDNAAKYSMEGSPIVVWWAAEGDMGVLRVIDNGQGVPPQGQQLMFTRFGRVPGSKLREGRIGTGLGLYLGRGLARAMGGDLDLESTGPNGSTFRLRLPLAVEPVEQSAELTLQASRQG